MPVLYGSMAIIDTNVYLSRWPFRRLNGDQPQALVGKMNRSGVTQAWAGSFDALLHRDLGGANARLATECRNHGNGMLVPFGSVNPKLPDWREELRRCHEDHRMPGLRLHPDFHDYKLDDPVVRELVGLAAQRRMIVQIAAQMEDERTVHPLLRLNSVPLAPLPGLVRAVRGARILLSNYRGVQPAFMRDLAAAGEVYADFSMIEGVHGLERLSGDIGPARVVFGSYFPFYYFEAAHLKVKESGLPPEPIFEGNARRLMGDPR
ncbi:MAG: amidohydrolase family protein [Bryobacteraceae bacterium]